MSAPQIPMKPCRSSMLSSHGYDPVSKTMVLTFHGGKTYTYPGVPQTEYDALARAKSLGKHFAQHIRGKFKPT